MDIFLTEAGGLANQIYEQIRAGVVEGRLTSGDRLPPTRELAATLSVSRHTVTTAYGRLSAEGYLDGHQGGGTVVSALFQNASRSRPLPTIPAEELHREVRTYDYDLRVGTPDPRLFPVTEWKRHVRWAVDESTVEYGDPAGISDVRRALARWIARSRGVETGFGNLMVTSGAQQALYLVARVCAGRGDIVAVEDPGYLPFRRVLESIGANPVPVPVDDEGIIVDAIPEAARLTYVTPSHQFPTGVTMSMSRRTALLDLAKRRGMVIIEDDYDSEYRYVDRPLEPLLRLAPNGPVVYVASFAKILSPSLRLGFAVVPSSLWSDVIGLRQLIDWAPPAIGQLALRGFIVDGHLDRHLRRARRTYKQRHQRMASVLNRATEQGVLRASVSNAGLHVAARLVDGTSEAQIVERLADKRVAIEGYGRYAMNADHAGGLVFGFGLTDGSRLEEAAEIVQNVLLS